MICKTADYIMNINLFVFLKILAYYFLFLAIMKINLVFTDYDYKQLLLYLGFHVIFQEFLLFVQHIANRFYLMLF